MEDAVVLGVWAFKPDAPAPVDARVEIPCDGMGAIGTLPALEAAIPDTIKPEAEVNPGIAPDALAGAPNIEAPVEAASARLLIPDREEGKVRGCLLMLLN